MATKKNKTGPKPADPKHPINTTFSVPVSQRDKKRLEELGRKWCRAVLLRAAKRAK